MSGPTTSATWANAGASGNWDDPTQWTPATVPGAATGVLIGSKTTAPTVPWTVTVAGSQAAGSAAVDMGTQGTLSVTGGLAVGGDFDLGYGAIAGATVEVAAGGSIGVGGDINALASRFVVAQGGTVNQTGGYADLDSVAATVNGAWNATELWIGQFFSTELAVGAGGDVTASAELNLGYDGTQADPYTEGFGTLDVTGGGVVSAPTLNAVNIDTTVEVDAASAVMLGGAASVAGAVAIGASGVLALEAAVVDANVVDDGTLTNLVNPDVGPYSEGSGATITGTLSGTGSVAVGTGYTLTVDNAAGFAGGVTIAPGATLKVTTGDAPSGPIAMDDGTLDLVGLAYGSGQALGYDGATGVLTVGGEMLHVGAGLKLSDFTDQADSSATPGTLIAEVACYAAGTRIATACGEAPVETLRRGDLVRTAAGRIAPVRWVGARRFDVRAQPHAAPVRIAAGAFGPGLPRRDLLVSGDHAIAVDGGLVPARKLLNGATLRQDDALPTVTYVHVELDRHDLLLAEGLAAESFLDTGNRDRFGHVAPAPRFDRDPTAAMQRIFAARGCAELHLGGPLVEEAQAQLRMRAAALGWRLADDPELRLEADRPGLTVLPQGPEELRVTLPPGARWLRLHSRRFVPYELDPAIADGRRLGVALAAAMDGTWLPEMSFASGWYPPDAGAVWRWTDGAATLALPPRAHPAVLTLHLVHAGARYWVQGEALAAAA